MQMCGQGDALAWFMRLTQGRGVDALIDLVSADPATALLPLLRHNGEMVCVVGIKCRFGYFQTDRAVGARLPVSVSSRSCRCVTMINTPGAEHVSLSATSMRATGAMSWSRPRYSSGWKRSRARSRK
ncbi:Zinc-binding dehydrogenase [Paraburkholderia caribensis]|nr:Zinc-binding dehydrogenase [Paraburkholderia caribensis]